MATEALKTAAITALDLVTPPGAVIGGSITGSAALSYRPGAGVGADSDLREVNGIVSPTNGTTVGSTYQMARLPSNAVVKHIWANTFGTFTTFAASVGLYYSTDTQDGTLPANQGLVVNSQSDFFANGFAFSGITPGTPQELTFKNQSAGKYGNLGVSHNQPLWQAAGLTGDPGGFFDIVVTGTGTAAVAGSATLEFMVQFMAPGTV